ncbi:MAG: type VII secretion protein EccB [Phycicoccus sp.]
MWSNRDQLQAYQFLRRRLVRSLVVAQPSSLERPDRRLVVSVLVGCGAAALVLAVIAVIGVIRPGDASSWRDGRSIVVEKETGTRFVVDEDGVLHQALNFTSAALFVGSTQVKTVSRKSLAKAPRGPRIGIPAAPDSLPPRAALRTTPWSVCSTSVLEQGRSERPELVVQVAAEPSARMLSADQAVLVEVDGREQRHLVVGGRRHLVREAAVLTALGMDAAVPVPVPASWLSSVPAGPDLQFLGVAGTNRPIGRIAGRPVRVGEVYEIRQVGGGRELVVVTERGLTVVGETAAQLIVGNPRSALRPRQAGLTPLSAADAAVLPMAGTEAPGGSLPPRVPVSAPLPGREVAVCASTVPGPESAEPVRLRVLSRLPASGPARAQRQGGLSTDDPESQGQAPAADAVSVAPGTGVLVRAGLDGASGASAVGLVTDDGVLYPLAEPGIAGRLGLGAATPVTLPSRVLALMPRGPVLGTEPVAEPEEDGVVSARARQVGNFIGRRSAVDAPSPITPVASVDAGP